jgi:hypothetical protein
VGGCGEGGAGVFLEREGEWWRGRDEGWGCEFGLKRAFLAMVKEIMKVKENSMALVNIMTLWKVTSFPDLFNEICCKRRAKVGDHV